MLQRTEGEGHSDPAHPTPQRPQAASSMSRGQAAPRRHSRAVGSKARARQAGGATDEASYGEVMQMGLRPSLTHNYYQININPDQPMISFVEKMPTQAHVATKVRLQRPPTLLPPSLTTSFLLLPNNSHHMSLTRASCRGQPHASGPSYRATRPCFAEQLDAAVQ